MYYYIYDSFLSDKKYNNIIARIENRLTDLGINGKINRLSFLKNIYHVVEEEIKRGVQTVVVVGSDATLGKIINLIKDLDITVGYIPIGQSKIASLLKIPTGENACDILSARMIKRIDLGVINNYYFITSLEAGEQKMTLECDKNYIINLASQNNIVTLSNLDNQYKYCEPNDGYLDLFIENVEKRFMRKGSSTLSYFGINHLKITSDKPIAIFLHDEKKIVKTPATIKIIPEGLKIIGGRRRK